ncbi:MAG: nuclear transport factor 2 family protein [Bacteroidetes bacterium]|nr:nuclear transport factor 2 family protein [Bacteroidota bacterium]
MNNQEKTKQLLESYYKGFAEKSGWEHTIADDFEYIGGDMTNTKPLIGKAAYIEVIKRFSQVFTAMRVVNMMIEGERACVIGNYDFRFPNGKLINGNVAEIWTIKDDKLQSLRIYFDTQTFVANSKK